MKFKRWYNNLFRHKVSEYNLCCILKDFIKNCNSKIVIHCEITRRGVVKLYTNKPGLVIGKGGKDIDELKFKLKISANVKNVKLYEMKNTVSNCGIY